MSGIYLRRLGWVLWGLSLSINTYAEVLRAHFDPQKSSSSSIEWDVSPQNREPTIRSHVKKNPKEPQTYYVRLNGRYPKTLGVVNLKKNIQKGSNGQFTIDVSLKSPNQKFTITVIDQLGQASELNYSVTVPQWDKLFPAPIPPSQKRYSLTPALGTTFVSFQQTGLIELTELALTAKLSGSYSITPSWQVGANAFYTLLPFSSSVSDTSIRFLGVNLRGGYLIPIKKGWAAGWNLYLNTGWYYTTSTSNPSNLAYENVQGPQFYPAMRKELTGGRSVAFYLKYSPVFSGSSFLTLSNRELALGGEYRFFPATKGHGSLAVSLDLTSLTLQLTEGSLQSSTYTLGMSYTL